MLTIETDLTLTETALGPLQGSTMRLWVEKSPQINALYEAILSEPVDYRGKEPPKGYLGQNGKATPVKRQQIAIMQALAKCKFEQRFSQRESADILAQEGIKITPMGLSKVFKRYLEILELEVPKGKIVTIKNAKEADELAKRERKNLAKRVVKKAATAIQVQEALKEEGYVPDSEKGPIETPKEPIKETLEEEVADEFRNRQVIYTPTEKQIQFHQASETIVLYGGAAG